MQSSRIIPEGGGKPKHLLLISKDEMNRIQSWLHRKEWKLAAAEGAKLEKRSELEGSKKIAQNWSNTIEAIKNRTIQQQKERQEALDALRDERLEEFHKELELERQGTLKNAKKLIFYEHDNVKKINSAFRTSEVMRERRAQLQFSKGQKEIEKQLKEKEHQKIVADLEAFKRENVQREEVQKKKVEELVQFRKEQEKEREMLKELEEEEKKRDTINLAKMIAEFKEIQKQKELDAHNLKLKAMEEVKKAKKEKEEIEEEKKVVAKEEAEELASHAEFKNRLSKMIKDKTLSIMKENVVRRQKMGESVFKQQANQLAFVQQAMKKAIEEKEAKEAAASEEKERKRLKRLKEVTEFRTAQIEEGTKKRQELEEMKKWDVIQRFKRDELIEAFDQKKREKKLESHRAYKEALDKQVEETKAHRKQLVDEGYIVDKVKQLENTDKEILEYAKDMVEDIKKKGGHTALVEKSIKDFTKFAETYKPSNLLPVVHERKIDQDEIDRKKRLADIMSRNEEVIGNIQTQWICPCKKDKPGT